MKIHFFLHGSVFKLTREDTPPDIENNFILMKQAGLDTAVIWPSAFWWEEKKPGYPFNTGRLVLELAEKHGIKIIMELAGQLSAMEYMPDFLMKKEYYATDENGNVIYGQPSFGFLNYFHPEVNEQICRHFADTAKAYKDYPALIGYDVFNETMFRSFDEYTMKQFRLWLKEKYKTIDKLNQVWERTYSDFDQVDYQCWKWMSIMPEADYAAFRKASIGIFMKNWCDAVRSIDDRPRLIADNIGSMVCCGYYDRPQDDYALKEAVDEVGMSFYPKQVNGCIPPEKRWCMFEGLYSASKREGFYISEMQTHTQALFNPTTAVRPHELKQWCMEGIASGAKALIYWMWRPFTKGLQTLGRGLVDYKGRSTPRLETVKELSRIIEQIGAVEPLKPDIAILYDDVCEDFQRLYTKAYSVDQEIYLSSIQGAYGALFRCGINADIIKLNELNNYKAVILTNNIVISSETAKALKVFVNSGGVVICDGKTGITDELSMLHSQLPGGDFNEYMGMEYIDTDYENLSFEYKGISVNGCLGRDIAQITNAECAGTFADGTPAAIICRHSKGCVVTFNTHLWYGYEKTKDESVVRLAKQLTEEFELGQFTVTAPLHARFCQNKKEYVIFVFNYTNKEITGSITSEIYSGEVKVGAKDVTVIRKKKNMPIPYKQLETRVCRTYTGGKLIDEFLGKPDSVDCNKPEDWISSFTEAKNKDYVPDEGITRVQTPEGARLLTEIVESRHFGRGRTGSDVLIKLLDSAERLGIQVHPTPEFANKHFGTPHGKTECWHILGTRDNMDGAIYIGFKEGISQKLWREMFEKQDIDGMLSMLHRFKVKPGDTVLVKAGTPHAIGAGCFLLEIQEPSDYTMRVEKTTPTGQKLTDMQIHYGAGAENMLNCFDYRGMSREAARAEYFVKPIVSGSCTHLVTYRDTPCFKMDMISDGYSFKPDCIITLIITKAGTVTTDSCNLQVNRGDKLLVPYGCGSLTIKNAEAIVCYPPEREELKHDNIKK